MNYITVLGMLSSQSGDAGILLVDDSQESGQPGVMVQCDSPDSDYMEIDY